MITKIIKLWGLLVFASINLAASCHDDPLSSRPQDNRSIVVIYDNDVHCAVEGYAKMAGYRDAIANSDTAWVATVSAGDFVQGGAIGSLSNGQYVIDIMKEMGYDAITLGNHEFDYKMPQLHYLMGQLPEGVVTSCNFYNAAHDTLYYKEYVMKQMGSRRVAFVGVTTPGAIRSEAAAFVAEDGVTYLDDLCEDECAQLVQNAVDKARAEGADYVILLAHLGELDRAMTPVYTPTLLAKTRGIDVVLDGHTHSVIPGMKFPNIDGDSVYNMQTGTKFEHVGKLVITADGRISTELVPLKEITETSPTISKIIEDTKAKVDSKLTKVIGMNHSPNFHILDSMGVSKLRYQAVPFGTLVSEAIRHYTEAEIGMMNGGGIRSSLPQGEMTYGKLLDIMPFQNTLMVVSATGQQILDALESSFQIYPLAFGGFLQFSGLRYEFNPDVKPELKYDHKTLELTVIGPRRITKCEVEGPDGKYAPIDPNRKYRLGSTGFVMKESMETVAFRPSEVLLESNDVYLDAVIDYIINVLHGEIPADYGL